VSRAVIPVALALIFAAGGCARAPTGRFKQGVFTRGQERFRVDEPGGPWRRIAAPSGDLAWEHDGTHAVIAANATCRGHKDPPAQILLNDLLIGTTDRRLLLDEVVLLDGRDALHQVVAARLDGVSIVFDLYVLKKDGCVYDLALLARPGVYDRVADAFVTFVAGFRGLGKGSS
jgi:hypothetical protein